MCAVDDDKTYQNEECSKPEVNTRVTLDDTNNNAAATEVPAGHQQHPYDAEEEVEAPVFDLSKRLSCKWSSGLGPRIGCVRDYPADLQFQALEKVNLSPRVNLGRHGSCAPIPSPRPSPNIRVSPRLAYMGLPSPRVPVPKSK